MLPHKKISHIYNPDNQTREELISNFVVRQKIFSRLLRSIKDASMKSVEQSYLIQGQRGTGKTTLLLRLQYEIEADKTLSPWLIPLRLSEEQYNIFSLCRLWETIAEQLEDSEGFDGLADHMEAHYEAEDYDDFCFRLLEKRLQQEGKKLLLLIDNIADLFGKLTEKECRKLRDILHVTTEIRLIAASARSLEQNFHHDKAFYEFFNTIYLEGLNQKETETLLLQMARHYGEPKVEEIVEKQRGRVESLRRLTGGIPRTIILLFEIFVDEDGSVFEDLELVLDRITPLYKHRMDDLSSQQQAIMDVIAKHWDAVGTSEIARKLRMESKAVSSQLRQLEKNNLIHSIKVDKKNKFYLISERFFNIWYLMRYGRKKTRAKVLWLTRFFEQWCSDQEIQARALTHITRARQNQIHGKGGYYLCEALAPLVSDPSLEHDMVCATREHLEEQQLDLATQLSPSDKELFESAINSYNTGEKAAALKMLLEIKRKDGPVLYNLALLYETEFDDFEKAKELYEKAIAKGDVSAMYNLALLYQNEFGDFEKAKELYEKAIANDHVSAMNSLAILYETEFGDFEKAKELYEKAIAKDHVRAMNNLAILYETEFGDFQKAKELYEKAIAKDHVNAMYNLALLYKDEFGDFNNAVKFFKMAIGHGDLEAMTALAYGYYLRNQNKKEALELARLSGEQSNERGARFTLAIVLLWNNLFEESVQVFTGAFNPNLSDKRGAKGADPVTEYLIFLLAKKQHHLLLKLFQQDKLQLKDRYKPVYFALMSQMKEEFPKEAKRMGEELEETVDEILAQAKQMAEKYTD